MQDRSPFTIGPPLKFAHYKPMVILTKISGTVPNSNI